MKKTTFTLLLSLSCCWMAAQCPADITFSTQGQIDSFQINYPNCIEIDSNVIISGNDIVRLDSLYSLKKIGGQLRIEYTGLSDLTGLNNLDSLYGLEVYDNPQLNSLNVLENIHSIRNDVRIILNPSLKSLSGLDNLQNIRGLLGIYSNDSLATLNGLENLDSLGKCLDISSNPMLVSLDGLNGLRFIGGCKQYPASTGDI